MNAYIRVRSRTLHLHRGIRRDREHKFRLDDRHLPRCGADERERHEVLSRVALFDVRRVVIRMASRHVVLVRREAVLVLGMIVIVVGVRVERGYGPRRCHQGRHEQQRQDAVHEDESMGPGEGWSKR